MTVLEILTFPNPVLKQPCTDITQFDAKLEQLITDMFETMRQANGVGLAAPQIGLSQNLVVIGYEKKEIVLINPKLIFSEGTTVDEEGCLSCPGVTAIIARANRITVKAVNKKGRSITYKVQGYLARIMQHEMDHLIGTLIIDKEPLEISLEKQISVS